MKKLMTMLAAVGMAFGLFAEEPDPIVDTNDFASVTQESFSNDTQWTYNGAATKPIDKVWVANSLLNLATGSDKVQRTFVPNGAAVIEDAIYLDANINFEDPFDEAPVISDSDNAKVAAFVLDNSGIIEELGDATKIAASTNLYVIAGYNNNGTWEKRAFMFATPADEGIADKFAKRLTIKAYGDVMDGAATRMGFRFFLNGNTDIKNALAVKYVFPINDDGSIDFTTFIDADDTTTPYLGTGVKASLKAAVRSRCSDQTLVLALAESVAELTGFDLAGKGELANFTLTTESPTFIDGDSPTVTLNLVNTTVSVNGAIDFDQNSITFAQGEEITVTATYAEGKSDIVKWTLNGAKVTPTDDTYSWAPNNNDILAISAKAAGAYVDGVPFESFFGDDGALAYVNQNGGTLKLADNVAAVAEECSAIAFDSTKQIVLDLNGKTIKGSAPSDASVTVAYGTTLIITNSAVEAGHVAVPYGSNDGGKTYESGTDSVKNNGSLVIAGGIMDGKVTIEDGATATITGGTFMDAITDANVPSVLKTIGGNFKKGAAFGTEEANIPGIPGAGYAIVDTEVSGYWTVQEIETYAITVTPAAHGQVTVDKAAAAAGETVTVTATPEQDYKLGTITVKQEDETPVTVADGKFVMPAANVTVSATFIAKDCVAQIVGGQSFETLAEAVAEVADGQTIKLLKNYSAVANEALLINAHNVTLDLGGFSLTNVNVAAFKFGVAAGNTVTVTNGTVTMPSGSYGFHVGTNAVANIFCKMEKLSASNPVIDVYGGTLNCNAATELCSKSDVIRTKDKNLTSTVNISGGKYTTTCGQDIGIIHHYKDGHVLNLSITGGDFDAQSLIDAYKEKDTDPTGPSLIFTKFNASSTARFSDATLAAVKDHSIITEADLIADGCKVVADTEKTGWYKVAAIEYATYKVTTDEGVESYVVSNATAEVAAGAKFDIDETVTLTVYPTLKADYEFVTAECVLTDTLTEAKEYELKVVTKAAAPVIPPVAPGGAPVEVKAEDADKVVIKATAPAGSGITDEEYTAYFSKSVVDIGEGKVRVSAVLDETKIEFAGSVEDLGEEVSKIAAGAESATIAAKPGLYYYVEEANDVTKIAEPERDRVMATGATVTIPTTKFEGSGFYRLKCSTTQRGTVTGN